MVKYSVVDRKDWMLKVVMFHFLYVRHVENSSIAN